PRNSSQQRYGVRPEHKPGPAEINCTRTPATGIAQGCRCGLALNMPLLRRSVLWAIACLCSVSALANAQMIARLRTNDTVLRLQAGPEAPRLLSLQSPRDQW